MATGSEKNRRLGWQESIWDESVTYFPVYIRGQRPWCSRASLRSLLTSPVEESGEMSIRVECPNGHTLRVKDKYAGKSGRCPQCHARVYVPAKSLSEAEILKIVNVGHAESHPHDDHSSIHHEPLRDANPEDSGRSLLNSSVLRHTRVCPSCNEKFPLWYASCSHCGKFFDD
jgi:hypothetical protein